MANAIAVVVGAGPGLGSALVGRFVEGGMKVVGAARRPAKAGVAGATIERCDATRPDEVEALFAKVERELGAPDLVVYNAGAYEPGGILEITPEAFERCWRIGCFGGFLVGQAAARRMVPQGSGTLIFTGATASLRGGARFANLAVPKFGLRALSQSMARELGPKGVHVAHVVIDGQIESEANHEAPGRGPDSLLPPEAIAESYWQLHRQPRGAWTQELDLRPWVEKF
jgi:NAD(P)-dependent dehydrogenase (short-subunit alcohol dehydrogenase family)